MDSVQTYSLIPDSHHPRREHNFCAAWRFRKGDIPDAQRPDLDDSEWERISLPHCFNAEDTFTPPKGYYRGPAWYRKRFVVEDCAAERRAHLVFEGAFAVTRVWLNGRELASSVDGYTGMAVDVTDVLTPGENVIAVRVDNTHDPDVLPGLEEPDYDLYGGIYREAVLIGTHDLHVPRNGLRITTPTVSAHEVTVKATVHLCSSQSMDARLEALVHDPDGAAAARTEIEAPVQPGENIVEVTFPTIARPRLWSPQAPNLYRASVNIYTRGQLVDQVEIRFGLRWFEFDRDRGFFLNGEHLRLLGVNRHQDYPGLGNALPPRLQRADAELIKAMGANFVRASHYPQHHAFLDACDEFGICVYEEIASWQFIGGPAFADNAEAMMRAMIRRDANHPSIILWGLLNEGRDLALFQRLHAAAREEDTSRPTIYAENHPEKGLALGTVWVPDVLGINYEIYRLDEVRGMFPDRRLLSSEHANVTTFYPASADHCARQVDAINRELDILDSKPWIAGSALWSMHDYGTDYEVSRPVQRSGALDEYRRPKESFHLLCARWRQDAFVHIEGHWNPIPGVPKRTVRVYTNCDSVTLRLNGRALGGRSDGFIRIWELDFEPGSLQVEGMKDGVLAAHEVRTHGRPANVILAANAAGLDGPGDGCWLTAFLLDDDGAPVLTGQYEVEFLCSGPLRIRGVGGATTARTTRGVARVAVTMTEGRGEATACARTCGITSNSVQIRTPGAR
jgi:beta-galactosidase